MRKVRRVVGPKAIGSYVGKTARAALVRRGFAHADILSKWASIVGPNLYNVSSPERLSFSRHNNRDATLKVRVSPGHAPEFQHFEPLIVERINSFFGYSAVGRLQIIQAPIKRPKLVKKVAIPEPTHEQAEWLAETLNNVEDKELKKNLLALGKAIVGTKPA
ncbi:MAG: DciA family protein [Sneathiella sp.]